MNLETPISELLRVICDREWHDIYELHERFKLSSVEIYASMSILKLIGIIEQKETNIRLKELLNDKELSIMNRLSKTYRPSVLKTYTTGS